MSDLVDFEDFVPISANVLVEGMQIDYSIYYKIGDNYILLCKDVILSKEILARLKKTQGVQGKVYVQKKYQKALLKESASLRDVGKEPQDEVGYSEIKGEVKHLLDIVAQNNIFPVESTMVVSDALTDKVQNTDSSLLIQCINSVRNMDEYLYTHSVNVAMLNGLIGKWAKFDDTSIATLVKIGLLHDIGKLRIPEEILNKPSSLLKSEFEIMKTHSTYSYDILKQAGELSSQILLGVKHHHEKSNGTGYPDHLNMGDIPEFARITSVSDVYDAMVSARVYKSASSPFKILAEFAEGRFSTLDPRYVNILLKYMPDELVHKLVWLSNGTKAEVIYINPNDYTYPIVRQDDNVFTTNEELSCVSMCIEKKDYPDFGGGSARDIK